MFFFNKLKPEIHQTFYRHLPDILQSFSRKILSRKTLRYGWESPPLSFRWAEIIPVELSAKGIRQKIHQKILQRFTRHFTNIFQIFSNHCPRPAGPDFRILAACLRSCTSLLNSLFKSFDLEPQASRSRFQDFGSLSQELHFSIKSFMPKLRFGASGPQVQISGFWQPVSGAARLF